MSRKWQAITFGLHNLPRDSELKLEKLSGVANQFELFKLIYSQYDRVFMLESLEGPRELAEISLIGFDPRLTVVCSSSRFRVNMGARTKSYKVTDPLAQLRTLLPTVKDRRYKFVGGAVGYVSYDAVRFWERLPQKKFAHEFPLMEFGIYFDGILFNHKENQAYYFYIDKSRKDEVQKKIAHADPIVATKFKCSSRHSTTSSAQYERMVEKAKKYIYKGHVFQVVLSKRIKLKIEGDLLAVYERLREVNPSPYMYFFKTRDRCIIGSSPEMLVRVTGGTVETFPIAGTRPVVRDQRTNDQLRDDLLKDEKEIAEHTMLVDLARNDVGRVCEFGTVKVNELMAVKQFSHVQHIVSHVSGKLREGMDGFDALKAVFPAGTVSGAPKVRAMEIIDELEHERRGPYAGALGYFSLNGSCDFAIMIRSIFVNKGSAYIQSGAGIVMDSNPKTEWMETEHKAGAMLSALGLLPNPAQS